VHESFKHTVGENRVIPSHAQTAPGVRLVHHIDWTFKTDLFTRHWYIYKDQNAGLSSVHLK